MSRSEQFSQVMVALAGCHDWSTQPFCSSKIPFIVISVRSSGLSLTAVSGLALRVCYTRHIVELRTSLVRLQLPKIAIITSFTALKQSFSDSNKLWRFKFGSWSLMLALGYPRLSMNLVIEATHDSVFNDCATLMVLLLFYK